MLRVKDENNNIVSGLIKNNIGALIVSDVEEYNKYIQYKQHLETINKLKQDTDIISDEIISIKDGMSEIRTLLQTLINNSK